MVAPKVCTGFEFGTTAGFATGNGGNRLFDVGAAPTITSTGAVRTGTYCLELSPTATIEWVGWDTSTLGASTNRFCLNMWIRFPTSLPANDCFIAVIETSGGYFGLKFRNSDDKLCIDPNGGTAVAGPVVAADTWYHVELYINSSANPWTCDWWIDTAAQTQATIAAAAATSSRVFLGDDVAQTMVCRYDDLVLWTDTANLAAPFDKHKVQLLIPDTGGTTAEIGTANATARMVTNSAIDATHNSADILAALSEVPPLLSASSSGIGQRTSGTGNACGIPMTTYTLGAGESFSGLRIIECGWAASTTANAQGLRTFNGTTEDILFAAGDINASTSTTAPAWLCKMAVDGRFDTQAEVDALVVRWGYSGDISPLPGAHVIYGELAVKEAVSTSVTGTAAVTQADDTSTASGQLGYTGTTAVSQEDQTSSASGTANDPISGTATPTQEDQTSTASGDVTGPVTGTATPTQDDQTSSASGQLGYSGTSTVTQADQTSTASGQLGYSGTSTATQADQTSTASGQLGYTGTVGATQEDQTSTASGTVAGIGEISGSAAATQDDQTPTATGQLGYTGTTAASQADQTSTAAGTVINPVTGTAAATQDDQTSAAAGQLGYSGMVVIAQADQTAAASGTFAIAITGLIAALQSDQTAAAVGFVGVIPIPAGIPVTAARRPYSITVTGPHNQVTVSAHGVTTTSDSHVVEV